MNLRKIELFIFTLTTTYPTTSRIGIDRSGALGDMNIRGSMILTRWIWGTKLCMIKTKENDIWMTGNCFRTRCDLDTLFLWQTIGQTIRLVRQFRRTGIWQLRRLIESGIATQSIAVDTTMEVSHISYTSWSRHGKKSFSHCHHNV